MNTFVIIGSSAAGLTALSLLSRSSGAHVICITRDTVCYNTCLLSAVLSGNKTIAQSYQMVPEKTNESLSMLYGTNVTSIDRAERAVYTATGERIGYDKLLLATGSKPYRFSNQINPSEAQPGIFSYHTLEDIITITAYISQNAVRTALVVGGGVNGLECAAALAQLGLAVTIIEKQEHILKNMVDRKIAQALEELFCVHGVRIKSNNTVTMIHRSDFVGRQLYEIGLSDGLQIQAEIVIFAIGSRPSIDLAEQALLATDKGVLVNCNLQTSDSSIFAAGDCIELFDHRLKKNVVSTLWHDAIAQSMVAAYGMMGIEKKYGGFIRSIHTGFFGTSLVIYGDTSGAGQLVYQKEQLGLSVYYLNQVGIIVGFILYGHKNGWIELKNKVANSESFTI